MNAKIKISNIPNYGFSLIELSAVLLILGLMIGGIMAVLTQDARRSKQTELALKIDAIEQAIGAFVKKNNRLPCPADGTYSVSSANFGVSGGTAGDGTCTTGATYDGNGIRTSDATPPTANFSITNIAGGVIPIRSLGLSDEYAFDPWGGRFTYAADKRLTATDSFFTYSSINTTGGITVNDNDGNTRLSNAIAVVISHGQNGHGTFQLSGARKNAGSTNANELLNCNCTSGAVASPWGSVFVMGANIATSSTDLRTNFDDTLHYYTRGSFLNNIDIKTESK
ncbi:MAG: prepilin-type N-terminal cleavage/methylation domain-containing protein [Rickettsiales bacterium]